MDRQNDQTFRERTGAFRKLIKNHAELVFMKAPNNVPPLDDSSTSSDRPDERGWWFSREDRYYTAQDVTECCQGYQESLDLIRQTLHDQGPFDGVLAFSQGAAMLTLLCSLHQRYPDMFPFNFAIFVAGFKSRSAPHQPLYETRVTLPSLHVFGETDKVIPQEMSEEILCLYEDPIVLKHAGGHFIPASSAQKKTYVEFLEKMSELKKRGQH